MAVLNSGLDTAFTPEAYGELIDTVLPDLSAAFVVSTVIRTEAETLRVPVLNTDPSVGWYAENTQISLSDPGTDEIVLVAKKTAGLTTVSNEAIADASNPAVAQMIGRSLARSIGKAIDTAFTNDGTVPNAPKGLMSLVGVQTVDTNGTYTSLDPFHDAKAAALANDANVTHWLMAPDVVTALNKAKQATGSNMPLVDIADRAVLAGATIVVSPAVAAGEVWALDRSQVVLFHRSGTSIARSNDSLFDYDAVQLRGVWRGDIGFANPAGVVRLYDAA